jgi:hypothetical protein
MTEAEIQLLERLKNSDPAILFIGQSYLRNNVSSDMFLTEISRKFTIEPGLNSYELLFNYPTLNNEAFRSWSQRLSENISIPDSIKKISEFSWSHVYTSSIDGILARAFKTNLRTIQPIFNSQYRVEDPRSRVNLHLTYLYGLLQYADADKSAPLTKFELSRRKAITNELLGRLKEITTPKGVVIIDGWDPSADWLSSEDFFSILSGLNKHQIHLFGTFESHLKDEYLINLKSNDKLVVHQKSLSQYLTDLQNNLLLNFNQSFDDSLGSWLKLGGKRVRVPQQVLKTINKSAILISEATFEVNKELNPNERLDEFKNFVSFSTTIPRWQGYALNFAFKREFNDELLSKIKSFLHNQELEFPLIVQGQASCGKTIALGQVCYDIVIKNDLNVAVLFIERNYRRIEDNNVKDIDEFCLWAEDQGAVKTVIIYDGMLHYENYSALLRKLTSRGRKVILVGTSYLMQINIPASSTVHVNIELSASEQSRFADYIKEIVHDKPALSNMIKSSQEKNFLAILYHYLPNTKSNISKLVRSEAKFVSDSISSHPIDSSKNAGILQELLEELGFESQPNEIGDISIGGERATLASHFINTTMIIGKLGLSTPFELLLRSLGSSSYESNFFNAIPETDFIRWHEDHNGNISVGPRTQLEAVIYTNTLGGVGFEVEYISKILKEIRDSSSSFSETEIEFASILVQELKKKGRPYRSHIYKFAEILGSIRNSKQAINARLMLQEASLLQEAIKERLIPAGVDKVELLDIAEDIIRQALVLEEASSSFTKIYLNVELASIIATKGVELASVKPELAKEFFEESRNEVLKSSFSGDNYHALDVLLWTIRSQARLTKNPDEKAVLYAEAIHYIQFGEDEGIAENHLDEFNGRKVSIGEEFGEVELSDKAFAALENAGSYAGYLLRAKEKLAGVDISRMESLDSTSMQKIRSALDYLKTYYKNISKDSHCLYFMLKLWWITKTRQSIFSKEKIALKFSADDWTFLLSISNQLLGISAPYLSPSIKYLKGLSQFHCGVINEGFESFKELSEQTEANNIGRKRIKKFYLFSNSDGQPKIFNGLIDTPIGPRSTSGRVIVTEWNKKVKIFYADFRREFPKDESIDFYIAFNFIGPLAIPVKL